MLTKQQLKHKKLLKDLLDKHCFVVHETGKTGKYLPEEWSPFWTEMAEKYYEELYHTARLGKLGTVKTCLGDKWKYVGHMIKYHDTLFKINNKEIKK